MIAELGKGHTLPPSSFEFKRVDERSSLFPLVKTIFENDLTPIFGNQTEILTKIAKESNRRCEVLTSGDAALGLIVWKRAHEKDDSLIVPTIHVINPKVNSVPVIGEALIDRLMKCAQRNSAKKVHVTVPQSDSELLTVFGRKKFSIIETTQIRSTEKYKYLLSCSVAEKTADQSISSIEAKTLQSETSAVPLIPKKKREREETAPSSAILPIDGSEQTQRDDSRDSSRKRHAAEDSSGDRSGNYPRYRDDHRDDRRYDRRDDRSYAPHSNNTQQEPRRGIPIANPLTRGNDYQLGRPPRDYYGRQDDNRRGAPLLSQTQGPQSIRAGQPSGRQYSVTLMKKYIHQIRDGGKTIEGRINSGQFRNYKEGDTVRFFYMSNPNDDVTCRIIKLARFSSFPEMLEKEGFRKCLSDVHRLDDAITVYNNIPGYREKAAQHGVIAIHLEVIK